MPPASSISSFEDLGEQTLKNIARPLRAYRVATGAVSATAQDTLAFPLPEFTAVRASRGKSVRAEPVAALYDQGRVHHIGTFPQLEDQMANLLRISTGPRRGIHRTALMPWSGPSANC